MPRKGAKSFLREALRAHRLEELTRQVGERVALTGRVVAATTVRGKFVVSLFEKWPEPGCVSLWFVKSPAEGGLPEDPAAWVGRVVRVEGRLEAGSWESTFWIAVESRSQVEFLAEEAVAD